MTGTSLAARLALFFLLAGVGLPGEGFGQAIARGPFPPGSGQGTNPVTGLPRNPAGPPPRDPVGSPPRNPVGPPPRNPTGAPPGNTVGSPPRNPTGRPPIHAVGRPPLGAIGRAPLNPTGGPPRNPAGPAPRNAVGDPPLDPTGPPPFTTGTRVAAVREHGVEIPVDGSFYCQEHDRGFAGRSSFATHVERNHGYSLDDVASGLVLESGVWILPGW